MAVCTVHHVALDRPLTAAELVVLSPAELARAERFVSPHDHRRFVHAHAAVRRLLGEVLGRAPASLRFVEGPRGKPALAPASGVAFNLSHSGEHALVAIAADAGEVGVDIEVPRERVDHAALAASVFSPAERAELAALPDGERRAAFFRGWARKEAFIKAIGLGLGRALDSFDVALADGAPALLATRPDAGEAARFRMWPLSAPGDAATALVTTTAVTQVEERGGLHGA